LLVTLVAYLLRQDTESPMLAAGDAPVWLDVPVGMRAEVIGRELHRLGLVRHPLEFRLLVAWRGSAARLRAGRYTITPGLSLEQFVEQLERGEAARRTIVFPEGKSLDDMAALAAAAGIPAAAFRAEARAVELVRDLDPKAVDLEGYLFPDTYDVGQGEAAARPLVQRMVQRFRSMAAAERAFLEKSPLSLREAVTLASIVELESARPEERPRIAAVFLNRLKRGMPLATDPTIIFALKKRGGYDGNIRKKDLDIDSPYNTYRHGGLPPGPIASPGRQAFHAVLEPLSVKDLYFVSRNDGTHEFSETLQQHELAVNRYQRYRQRALAAPPTRH
jgi:UPF0755 protein